MNVLFLLNNYPGFRGIEKVTHVLTDELRRQGGQTTILSLGTDAPECLDLAESCVMVPNRETIHSPENVRFVAEFLEQYNVDFIVYQDSYAASEFLFREIDYPWRQKLIEAAHNSPLYEESALLLMTAVFEGVSLVLNEAMSRGCVPLVFGSFSSVYDVIDDGVNGRILPPFHEPQYAAALAELAEQPELRERMARAAMEKAHRFSPEAAAQAWRVLFSTLQGKKERALPVNGGD
ncbi:MAG: glycosyltransferase [Akkermansia sp.]